MTTYTVKAERVTRGWILTAPDVPGAVSQVRGLSQAERHAREAIAFVLDVPEDSFELSVVPVLPAELAGQVQTARQAVSRAEEAQREAAALSRKIVKLLATKGRMTGADIAASLGLSPQRVSQLLGGVPAATTARKTAVRKAPARAARAAPVGRSAAKQASGRRVAAKSASKGRARKG